MTPRRVVLRSNEQPSWTSLGDLVLAPPPFEEHYFEVGECVCAISRHSGENNNGTMPWPEETIEMLKGRKRKSVMQGKVHWP